MGMGVGWHGMCASTVISGSQPHAVRRLEAHSAVKQSFTRDPTKQQHVHTCCMQFCEHGIPFVVYLLVQFLLLCTTQQYYTAVLVVPACPCCSAYNRAGVEVWNQEVTEPASIQAPGQLSTAGCSTEGHSSLQDKAATGMRPTCQQAARLHSPPPPSLAMLEDLARYIGPISLRQDEGDQHHVGLCGTACAAASQPGDSLAVEGVSVGPEGPLPDSQHHTVHYEDYTHNVHKLHFLVDNVQGDFWDTCIVVDVDHQAPAASVLYDFGVQCSTVSMRMSWENLRGLSGLPPRYWLKA